MERVNYLGDIKGDEFTIFTAAAPKFYSRTGYGSKIPTQYMVRFGGREYRVYAICFSNCASHYITIKGVRYYLHDYDMDRKG